MTLSDAVADYVAFITHEQGVTKTTLHCYKSQLTGYIRHLGDGDLDITVALSTDALRKYLYLKSSQGLRPRSIRGIYYPVKGLIKFLRDNNALDNDPMAGISMPKLDAPIRHTVSDQECALLLAACGRIRERRRGLMAKAILSCLIYAGIRASELLDLKLSDISVGQGTLTVVHGKYKKNRTLYPTDDTLDAIKDWLTVRSTAVRPIETDYLWAYDKRRRLAYNGLTSLIDEVKHIAGLADHDNIHPHALRRGFATRLMQAGASIKTIQSALGHANANTTFVYLADANEPARAMSDLARLTASSGALLSAGTAPEPAPAPPLPAPKRTRHDIRRRREGR